MRRGSHILLSCAAALAVLFAPPVGGPVRAAADPSPEERLFAGLPLEGLSAREKTRIHEAVRKLVRIHEAAGDPGAGEVETYAEAVDALARFLKRETVEERRRLYAEAKAALDMVDRPWIDRTFQQIRTGDAAPTAQATAKLGEAEAGLRRVGRLLKREQAIVGRKKGLTTGAERRYRDLLRLNQEGRRVYESIDNDRVQSALLWMLHDLDRTLEETVRPIHDRHAAARRPVPEDRRRGGPEGDGSSRQGVPRVLVEAARDRPLPETTLFRI